MDSNSRSKKSADNERPHCYIKPFVMRARIARNQPLGLPVINMAYNELPYAPAEFVSDAIAKACLSANRYGDPRCAALQEEICRHNKVDADSIICGNGSEELLDVIARNFIQAGDEIVISEFGYIQFELIANRLNARLVKAAEHDFTAQVDNILETIGAKTRLVFLANPNNPTGTMMPETDVLHLINQLPTHVVLVLDLAYGEFAGRDYCVRMHALVEKHNNLIVTRTFSKAFSLAGLRIGWCHAPAWMIPGFYAARGMGTVNAVAQAAAIASLKQSEQADNRVKSIINERERVALALHELGVSSLLSRTNFLLLTIEGMSASRIEQLVDYIFDEVGILVTYSREGGLETFFRVSISLPEHNDTFIRCIGNFMDFHRAVDRDA